MSNKALHLPAAGGLSLAAAKPLSPNELSQSYTPSASGSLSSPKTGTKSSSAPSEDHIRVVCRFRPKNSKERSEEKRQNMSSTRAITVYEHRSLEIPRGKKKPSLNFTLDHVIWSDKNQEETFINLAKKSVESVIEGYNCTIFAFGQTGSGKTYTMFGPESVGRVEELGIIPRSVDYMFKLLNSTKNIMKYEIKLSICEVYKEMLRDLLSTEKKNRKRLEILSAGKEIRVKNLLEKSCDSVSDILRYIVLAQSNRAKHTTDFIGHESSRSHCVVIINLTQRMLDDSIKFSKLNFGDLAGSELAAKTGAKGSNLKEAGKIHQGLLALENVINALVEHRKHIPYNDSKLTRLLSTSIGGNAKTTLLVTCSPSIWNRDETVSTLRFARRAKKIKNIVRINKRRTREQLESRIAFLEKENTQLKKKLTSKKYGGKVVRVDDKELMQKDGEISKCLDEIIVLKDVLSKKEDSLGQMEEDLEIQREIVNEFDIRKKEYDVRIRELNNSLSVSSVEISKLQGKLDAKLEMEAKFVDHTHNLENIVNDSVRDTSSTMISALTEITAQQNEFFNYLKRISDSIGAIHDKQHATEKDIATRFDGLNSLLQTMDNMMTPMTLSTPRPYGCDDEDDGFEPSLSSSEYDVVGHHPQSSGSLLNFGAFGGTDIHSRQQSTMSVMSSMTLPQDQGETLTELILSMRSYLDNDASAKKSSNNTSTKIRSGSTTEYSVGTAVDVLDVSCIWYSAQIADIDAFDKRAVYVCYDSFDEGWNEWIPLSKKYRIAPHKSRTNDDDDNGIHCLIATKYGRSANAEELQMVFSKTNYENRRLTVKSILNQGHLYQQAQWSKKTWNRRWFVVRNNENIYYYDHKNQKSKQYRGIIALNQISVIQLAKTKGYTKYSFDIITHKNKKYRFSANNQSDLCDWLSVLECLVYSVCPQISVNHNENAKQYIMNKEEDDEKEKEKEQEKPPPKRPISPRIRETLSEWFSAKPKQYTATYETIQ